MNMDGLKIPRFENEADEANWAHEHREELAAEFIAQFPRGAKRQGVGLEAGLHDAVHAKKLGVAPEELDEHSLVSVLRKRLARK